MFALLAAAVKSLQINVYSSAVYVLLRKGRTIFKLKPQRHLSTNSPKSSNRLIRMLQQMIRMNGKHLTNESVVLRKKSLFLFLRIVFDGQ